MVWDAGGGSSGGPFGPVVSVVGCYGECLATESTLSEFNAKFGIIGQHASAGSVSVVIASDQIGTLATQATLAAISAQLPATLGQKTSANSFAVVISSDQSALPVTFAAGASTIVSGGAKGATTAAIVTSTANGANHQGLDVVEQFAPVAEDNTLGAIFTIPNATSSSKNAWGSGNSGGTLIGNAGQNVTAAPGRVRQIGGTNTAGGAQYLLLVNKASAPVNGDQPVAAVSIPAGGSVVLDFGESAFYLSTGFSYAISSTPNTVTLGTSNCYVWWRNA